MELQDIIKPAVTIAKDASFQDAITRMIEEQSNSLLVIDETGALIGEVVVSDLLDAIVPEYLDDDAIAAEFATAELFATAVERAKDKKVSEFMTTDMITVDDHDSLMLVAQTAIKEKSARIPVIDADKKPVGIISRRGVKHLIADFLGIENIE